MWDGSNSKADAHNLWLEEPRQSYAINSWWLNLEGLRLEARVPNVDICLWEAFYRSG